MTQEPDDEVVIPRGKYIGKRLGDPPEDEAEHFIRCAACDGWIDCRDLGHVFEHERAIPTPGAGSPAMRGAQNEIRIDGTPRTYRGRKDSAHQEQAATQHGRGQRPEKWRRYGGG
jgi:hypothetical protein